MDRNEREQALWHDAYMLAMSQDPHPTEASNWADAAVEAFRLRFPPQPTAPPAVWYDEPPRPGEYFVEGFPCVCWVDEGVIYHPTWDSAGERPRIVEVSLTSTAGRRVCPIAKPPEPTT